jgi:hypothetical protein
MPYTLLLHGRLVGETEFDDAGPGPGQRLGILRPTEHGLEVLPRLVGFLSAAARLKQAIERRGLDPDAMSSEAMFQLLDHTPEGQRMVDVVKALDALELRDSSGGRVSFTSIAVSDLAELRRVARELGEEIPLPDDSATTYVISATLANGFRTRPRHLLRCLPRLRLRWNDDN